MQQALVAMILIVYMGWILDGQQPVAQSGFEKLRVGFGRFFLQIRFK